MQRAIGISGAVVLGTALLWVACGGGGDDAAGTGGADAAAEGGGGGTGGAATGGGGSGGTGAAGADAGWGATPKWESTGQQAAGCAIDFLANASEITALTWKPCAWSAECEEAVFNQALAGADAAFNPTSAVHDTGVVARIALAVVLPQPRVIVLDAAGSAIGGFRTLPSATECWLPTASVSGKRLAAMAGLLGAEHGGVLDDHDALGKSPKVFTLQNPPYGGAQETPLGESRWLWFWVPVERFSTVSAVDGSDFTLFAKATGETAMLGGPVAAGDIFLFDEWVVFDGGTWQRRISWSDGKLPPAPYLTPAVVADDFGSVIYANSVVGFFRGLAHKDVNSYASVELWSSPFSKEPSQLQPKKVADLPATSISNTSAGGFGRVAFPAFAPPNGKQEIVVWDLVAESKRSHVLPSDRDLKDILGVTRHHVYLAAAKPGMGPSSYLIRYPVP
ncbi:MAG: hypothetical protein IT377_26315 [Polyangiaceae bacterium]|nr:hypothetical protein [Polyangiaceae bacterium]